MNSMILHELSWNKHCVLFDELLIHLFGATFIQEAQEIVADALQLILIKSHGWILCCLTLELSGARFCASAWTNS